MPTVHVKDELYGRYVKATGKTDNFKTFVNELTEEAVKRLEKEVEKKK